MSNRTLAIDGVQVPHFLYGTAWKEDRTQPLVELAIQQGFRGIDTANQRKHYHEAAVGDGIAASIRAGLVPREELFLQTKFTFRGGQDDRLPYDPTGPIATQVEQSFASSLTHLHTDWLDSYVLHGPSQRFGLAPADWDAWRAMEALHDRGRVKLLGISNVSLEQLTLLCARARVRPRLVQNRCFAVEGWDRGIREFCRREGIVYQGFSLLTANRGTLGSAEMSRIARKYGATVSQVVFRFAIAIGMLPLTGTTSVDHMREDLAALDFDLEPADVTRIEQLGTGRK